MASIPSGSAGAGTEVGTPLWSGVAADGTPLWVRTTRAGQVVGLLVLVVVLPLGTSDAVTIVVTLAAAFVVLLTGLTFTRSSYRVRSGLDGDLAWALLALACAGATITVLVHGLAAGHAPVGPAATGSMAVLGLLHLTAIAVLVRGRSPRWAPSTGWDGPVVALGVAALAAGALELTFGAAPDLTFWSAAPAVTSATVAAAGVAALAVTAGTPRPRLAWLALGYACIVSANLLSIARDGVPALLAPLDGTAPEACLLLATAGYGVLGLAATAPPTSGPGRRNRPFTGRPSLAAGLIALSLLLLVVSLVRPGTFRVGGALALACVGVALFRTRRNLLAALRGSEDPRPRTDDLTGLANRRALAEALAGDRGTGPADGDESAGWSGWAGWADEIALLLVDLDRFKEVNEALGHDRGDELLAEVGARLRTALRPTQLLARLGGDEFAVVLPAAGAQTAVRVAHALRASLAEPFEIHGTRLHVQASVGVATCHPALGEPTDLLRQADVAMYHAKATGNGIEQYDPDRDADGGARLRRIDELREALERGDLEVHLQPQVDLVTGQICGAEALARWRHPVDGVLLPDSFLPLAESTGLMRPVSAQVLDRALDACGAWWAAGYRVPVSVNLRADDLRDPALPSLVTGLLARNRLPPAALRVELTEQALLTDPAAAATLLARWREDGIAVSIDDFGTGYSSLSYLRQLPVDEVKLDRSFVADIHRQTTTTIVRHTIALVHGLWARAVAEGIEDEATARVVTDLGCDVGQGLYFGGAVTPAEFMERLRTARP